MNKHPAIVDCTHRLNPAEVEEGRGAVYRGRRKRIMGPNREDGEISLGGTLGGI